MISLNQNMSKYGIVDKDIMTDPDVSLQAKGLYAILTTFADKERKCFPSVSLLADISNKSVSQVSFYLKELKNKHYIKREGKYLYIT